MDSDKWTHDHQHHTVEEKQSDILNTLNTNVSTKQKQNQQPKESPAPDTVVHNDSGLESHSDSPSTPEEERGPASPAESKNDAKKIEMADGIEPLEQIPSSFVADNLDNNNVKEEECSLTIVEKESEIQQTADLTALNTLIFLGDTKIYKIRIQVPCTESIDLKIGDCDICQELYHALLERDATCHRTCFKIYYENHVLDPFLEIKSIPGIKDNALFRVVEEPYNTREARLHVRHLRDILRCLDISDAANGVEGASFSCLSNVIHPVDGLKKTNRSPVVRMTDLDCNPPDHLLPGYKEPLLKPLIPFSQDSQELVAIKQLYFSSFNPPPGHRKLKGDVLYLAVETMEDRRFNITCCTRGFYVNATVGDRFRPEPSPAHHNKVFHSLFDLLSDLSPHFKKTLSQILKLKNDRHLYERLPTPYQIYSWMSPQTENRHDVFRSDEYTQLNRIGIEDHMPGQIRDWNEELQTTHDMPQTTITEQMGRDRARFKVQSDFVAASIRGSMAIVDGSVHTINPLDEPRSQMFIWNNIFFSYGFDVKDHYKEYGGDAAAHAAAVYDLNAVQAYTIIDDPKIHTLGMTVVDFKGYRVASQSIVPGILERDQVETVVYGSNDSGKKILSCEAYEKILENSAKQLKIAKHRVWSWKDERQEGGEEDHEKLVTLLTSFESKGIIGNDRRQYLLDLLRTFPPDPNFLEGTEVTEYCKSQGFPRKYKHKLVSLRQELIDSFVEFKTMEMVNNRSEGEHFDLKEILFNPDCFNPDIKHSEDEDLESQKKLVVEAAEFILIHQIPRFVRDCFHSAVAPVDGSSLTESLHGKGINMRYLGKVIDEVSGNPKSDYLMTIAKTELLCRSARHLFREYIRSVEDHCVAAAVAHFLNLLVGSGHHNPTNSCHVFNSPNSSTARVSAPGSGGTADSVADVITRKQKKKRRVTAASNNGVPISSSNCPHPKTTAWAKLNQQTLWKRLGEDAFSNYAFHIPCTNFDEFAEWSGGARRVATIRRFCILTGIQLALKNYQLDPSKPKSHFPFCESDVQNMFPVVKHIYPRSKTAYNLYLSGLIKMQQGFPRVAYDLMLQAQTLMNSVYGPLHPDILLCHRLMARMAFALGDFSDAFSQQHKTVVISERCNGIDHCETIIDYINLAHFSFVNLLIPCSLKLLYRARHLMLVAHGENHPIISQIDANIGVILYSLQEYDMALKFLQNSLSLYLKYDVQFCLKTALLYHVIARTQSGRGDFRSALQMEKETFNIYTRIFGKDHEKTQRSGECLNHLTKQAVNFQKHMSGATKGSGGEKGLAHLVPTDVNPPSVQNVVELLNGFNNFLFWKIQIKTD